MCFDCKVYISIDSVLPYINVLFKPCYVKTAERLYRDLLKQNIVTLQWQAKTPNLAPIGHVLDKFRA